MHQLYFLIVSFFLVSSGLPLFAQSAIEWQKTIGTVNYDAGLKVINDEDGHFIVFGTEQHEDITGTLRTYLIATKYDVDGSEIWSRYHDVTFQTHAIAFDYYISDHFYTEENGQKIINLVIELSGQLVLYKMLDSNGDFHYFDHMQTPVMYLHRDNVKITAATTCSFQQSCYGPDSLIVQMINPVADSNFNVIEWTFGAKQNIRTAPIQGHYDFDNNDISVDEEGNIYLLTQIERWDFQFCTDCGDFFIDAYSMIFKFNPEGELIDQVRLNITTAVISRMEFLSVKDGNIVVRINDINNAGTAVLSSIYQTDYDLNVEEHFDLDRSYNYMLIDEELNLYTVTNAYDPLDPNIIGASDVMVSKFDKEGDLLWRSYYGGTSFDFPKGFVLTSDDGIALIANTESTDFDVEDHIGFQDIWLVKLEELTTSSEDEQYLDPFTITPNPAVDFIQVNNVDNISAIQVVDAIGRELYNISSTALNSRIPVSQLQPGLYYLKIVDTGKHTHIYKFMKS